MKQAIFIILSILVLDLSAQQSIKTFEVGPLEIIEPSVENILLMLHMPSLEWIEECKSLGYSEGSPYTSARSGFLLINKGKVYEGGSSHISKMGKKMIEYEWYHKDSDPQSIFTKTLIQLENHIVKVDGNSVLYMFTHEGKQYRALHMIVGSQNGFLFELIE